MKPERPPRDKVAYYMALSEILAWTATLGFALGIIMGGFL